MRTFAALMAGANSLIAVMMPLNVAATSAGAHVSRQYALHPVLPHYMFGPNTVHV